MNRISRYASVGVGLLALSVAGCDKSQVNAPAKGKPAKSTVDVVTSEEVPVKTTRKETKAELKKRLTPLQYDVTQNDGTEPPFRNKYWDNKEHGVYVDIVSGEPLFASVHKFRSGTGWPSFWQPLVAANVKDRIDRKHGMVRSEVRSTGGDSHLGHVFDDGPKPTGLRYCINYASIKLEQED